MANVWQQLGIAPTVDEREIRRAYARRLKAVHPEDDPEGFQRLRAAYEVAMDAARWGELLPDEDPADPDTSVEQLDTSLEDREPDEPAQHFVVFKDQDLLQPSMCVPVAGSLVENLLSTLRSKGEQAAIEHLIHLWGSPETENLETRDDFESLLVKAVSQMDRKPYLLLAKVVDLFNIEIRAGLINSRLTYWHSTLLIHLETARCYARLLQTAQTKPPSPDKTSTSFTILPLDVPTEDQIFAAQILTGPFDLKKFRKIARLRQKRGLVLGLFKRLKANYPDAVRHALDPQVVGWWEHLAASRERRADAFLIKPMSNARPILIISWLLAMAAYELSKRRLNPWLLMAGTTLILIACRLGWRFYIRHTRISRWMSAFRQLLGLDTKR